MGNPPRQAGYFFYQVTPYSFLKSHVTSLSNQYFIAPIKFNPSFTYKPIYTCEPFNRAPHLVNLIMALKPHNYFLISEELEPKEIAKPINIAHIEFFFYAFNIFGTIY